VAREQRGDAEGYATYSNTSVSYLMNIKRKGRERRQGVPCFFVSGPVKSKKGKGAKENKFWKKRKDFSRENARREMLRTGMTGSLEK